jgi:hypothetical protein
VRVPVATLPGASVDQPPFLAIGATGLVLQSWQLGVAFQPFRLGIAAVIDVTPVPPLAVTTFVPPQGPGQRFSRWTPVAARDWKERQRKPDQHNQEHPAFPAPVVEAEPISPDTLAFLFAAFHAVDD